MNMNVDGSLGETALSGCRAIHNNSSGSINYLNSNNNNSMSMQKRSSNSLRRISSTNHPYHERVVEPTLTTNTLASTSTHLLTTLQRRNSKQLLSTSFPKRDNGSSSINISANSSLSSMDSASTRTSGGGGGGKLRSSFSYSLKRNKKISHSHSSHANILQRTQHPYASTSQLGKLMRTRQSNCTMVNSSSRELLRGGLSKSSSRNRINSNGSWGNNNGTLSSSLRKSSQSTPAIRYSPASNRNRNGQSKRSVLTNENTLEEATSSNKNAEWNVTPLSSRRPNPFTLKMSLAPPEAPAVNTASMPRRAPSGNPNPMQTMSQTTMGVQQKNLHQSSSNLLKTLLDMSNNHTTNGLHHRSGVVSCVDNGPIVSSHQHQHQQQGVTAALILPRVSLIRAADSTTPNEKEEEEEKKVSVLPSPNVPGLVGKSGDSINHTAVVVDRIDAIDNTSTSVAVTSGNNKLEQLVQENDTVVVEEEDDEGTADSTVNKAAQVQSDATAVAATDNDTTTKPRSNSWSTYPWMDSCSSLLASFTSPFRGLVTRSSSIVSTDNPQEPIVSEGKEDNMLIKKVPTHYPPRTPTKVRFSTMEDIITYEVTAEDIKKSWNVLNVPETLKNIEMISRHRGISVIYSDSAYTVGKTCMVHIEPVPLINEVLVARERHRTAVFREQARLKKEDKELLESSSSCCATQNNGDDDDDDDVEEQLAQVAARYSRWGVELALSSWWLER